MVKKYTKTIAIALLSLLAISAFGEGSLNKDTLAAGKSDKNKIKKNEKQGVQREVDLESYADINRAFTIEARKLLAYYNFKKLPLTAEILDSSNEKVKSFLLKDLKYSAEHPLASHYFPIFKVDGKESSFCFIYYDSKDNLFKAYESMKTLSKYESLQYLTWHEMGHCFSRYEKYQTEERKDEEYSDEFAVAVALNNNNDSLAKRIVKQVSYIDKENTHGNGEQVQQFYNAVIAKKIFLAKKNMNQITDVVMYFNQNGNLDNFKFKSPLIRVEPPNLNFVEPPKGKVEFINKNYSPK